MEDFFEKEVINKVEEILAEFKNSATKNGITINRPQKTRLGQDASPEIEICFSDESGIFDVIEFFIYMDGKPNFTLPELENWLRENITKIISSKTKQ